MNSPALHHVAIGTAAPESLADFYRAVFGLPEVARHHFTDGRLRSIWLRAGPTTLMFEWVDDDVPEGVMRAGPFLLAFQTTPRERPAIEARAEAHGARVESRTPYTSYWRDPAGNRVAVSHFPHAEPT